MARLWVHVSDEIFTKIEYHRPENVPQLKELL